jgi:hypothetical protein
MKNDKKRRIIRQQVKKRKKAFGGKYRPTIHNMAFLLLAEEIRAKIVVALRTNAHSM